MATATFDYGLATSSAPFTSSPNPASFISYVGGSASVNYTPSAQANGEYWFGVRQHLGGGSSAWIVRRIYILDLPAVPSPVSPADAAYEADTTPKYDWSDPANASTSQDATATTDYTIGISTNQKAYQSFQVSAGRLRELRVKLGANSGSPAGLLRWTIYTDTAGAPGTAIPTLTGTFAPTQNAWNTFYINAFASAALAAATTYWLELQAETLQTGSNGWNWRAGGDTYASGISGYRVGAGAFVPQSTLDCMFFIGVLTGVAVQVDTFELETATNVGFTTGVRNMTGIIPSEYTEPTPLADQDIYWHVRGRNASGVSAYSTTRLLHLQQLPTTPILLTPIHLRAVNQLRLGVGTTNRTSFTWTASVGVDTYIWEYASNPATDPDGGFTTFIQDQSGIVTTNYAPTWSPNPPAVGTRYWHIGAVNETGTVWSSIFTVTVTADTAWTYGLALSRFSLGYQMNDAAAIYLKATNPYIAEGYNIILDGDMEISGTAFYAAVNSATITKSTASPHAGANALRVARNGVNIPTARQTILTLGKAYRAQGWARGDGTSAPRVGSSGTAVWTGTSSTSWQAFDVYFIAIASTFDLFGGLAGTEWCEYDDVTVKQVNIKASTDYPRLDIVTNGNLIGDYAWTLAAGATITGGVMVFASGSPTVTQTLPMLVGKQYIVAFDITAYTSGTIHLNAGSGGTGTNRSTVAHHSETLTCTTTAVLQIVSASFIGSIDNITVVPADSLLVFNGDGSTTTGWTVSASAVLSSVSGWLRVARNGTNNPAALQTNMIIGRRYRLTADMRGDGAGAALPRLVNGASVVFTGTNSGSTQAADVTFVASATTLLLQASSVSVDGQYTEFDNVVLTEINPADLSVLGATMHQAAAAPFDYNVSFDGNDTIFSPSTWMGGYIDQTQGCMVVVAQSDLPSDGLNHYYLRSVFGAQDMRINKGSGANVVQTIVIENSVTAQQDLTVNNTNRHTLVNQWDIGASKKEAFLDGTEPVADVTTVGNIGGANPQFVIGSSNTAGANGFDGTIDMVQIFNDVLTPAEILKHAQLAESD